MKIAITGTIGSGKSSCSSILRNQGWFVFDCDAYAKEVQKPCGKAIHSIRQAFPESVDEEMVLDRKKLAELVFADEKKRQCLEEILHPIILDEMEFQAKDKELFFAEVPTLYESGWDKYFDGVLLISADEKTREERLMKSRSMTKDEIQSRVAVQLSDEEKRKRATWVIDNSGTMSDLEEKIIQWLDSIIKEMGKTCGTERERHL